MELKISSLNVNSLVEYRRRFMMNEFISRNRAHIYCLQETKFGPRHNYAYSQFSTFSSSNRVGCGGAALMIHNDFRVRNVVNFSGSIDAVFADVFLGDEWITIGSVYVHPKCSDLSVFENFLLTRNHIDIGGDFNARHLSFGDHAPNCIGNLLYNFSPATPTCFHSALGSYIDKFLVDASPAFPFSAIDVVPSFSDHAGICMTICCPAFVVSDRNGFSVKQYEFANVSGINRFVESELMGPNIPTDSGLLDGDLEILAERIGEIFSSATNQFVPSNFVRANGIPLSSGTMKLVRRAHTAQRKLHRNLRNGTWLPATNAIRNEVTLLRKMMIDSIRMDLSNHYRNTMANTISTRHAYKTIRTHTGYRRRAKCPGRLFTDELKTSGISGTHEIAECFCRQFAMNHNISPNLASDMDARVTEFCNTLRDSGLRIDFSELISPAIADSAALDGMNQLLPDELRSSLTSAENVSRIIGLISPKKSSGQDGMPYFLIKRFSPEIVMILTTFFNHSLSRSYFPKAWKHSLVTPIPKPDRDSSVVSNWRPISNLNCISKVFERIVSDKILEFVERLDIFQNQFGFLRGLSTDHALGQLQSRIDRGLNDGKYTTMVSLDLRAAFDTVWHDGLIYKLGTLGFPVYLSRMIQSFLADRTFAVKLDGVISDVMDMLSGTPQGSVCSPILFNIYVYDLPVSEDVGTIQYADDTTLLNTDSDAVRAQNGMNLHLEGVARYFDRWKLQLNERKTEMVVFQGFARESSRAQRRRFRDMRIVLNGFQLEPKKHIRFLGVILNRNNRAVQHVNHALARARRAFFSLRPIISSALIGPSIRVNVYKVYIRPIVVYGASIWARPTLLSSRQMEGMRTFERMILRRAGNVRRNRGSFKYANNSVLHEATRCPRIDRFIVERACNFFGRCAVSPLNKISSLVERGRPRIFSDLAHVWRLKMSNELYENGDLLLFHSSYWADRLVYNFNQ